MVDDGGSVFYTDAVGHFASGPCAAVAFAVGFAAYSEMLPQGAAVAFVLAEVAVNGAVMECDLVVFMQGALGKVGVNIALISQTNDEINIIVGVHNRDYEKTINTLYDEFK